MTKLLPTLIGLPKVSKNFLGKGETGVKSNKTAFAVLLQNSPSFDVAHSARLELATRASEALVLSD